MLEDMSEQKLTVFNCSSDKETWLTFYSTATVTFDERNKNMNIREQRKCEETILEKKKKFFTCQLRRQSGSDKILNMDHQICSFFSCVFGLPYLTIS